MITGIPPENQVEIANRTLDVTWQRELAAAVRDPALLCRLLELPGPVPGVMANRDFRLLVPHSFIARMRKGDWHDPLLRQVLPLDDELQVVDGFGMDPVGDQQATVTGGVLHKYAGRVLLVTTGACAVHCRYCFRRHFPYRDSSAGRDGWADALAYVRACPDVREVILSGGDPLALADERLGELLQQLQGIEQVQRVRFHTRLPVVLPSRVDEGLLRTLQVFTRQQVMVLHVNHAQELSGEAVSQALAILRGSGLTLLNQAVLLKSVNDNVKAQVDLSEALFAQGILPYYLFLLDRVAGAAHFEVQETAALAVLEALRNRLPGYLVPRLVREVAGAPAKLPVFRGNTEL